ncbi:MAG: MBL fold metallo-hydrolase [Candidatus Saccharicenans sp.]
MLIEFLGVRGTVPVSGRKFIYYGGETHCLRIISKSGSEILIDAGTGLRKLRPEINLHLKKKKLRFNIFFTHFHLDHIIGLPFFEPLYWPEAEFNFYSPWPAGKIKSALSGLMAEPYFPVKLLKTASRKNFQQLKRGSLRIGSFRIKFLEVNHPGGAFAYRVEEGNKSLVVVTDHEPDGREGDQKLVDFCRQASCLIYDSTYTEAEFKNRKGWGHSTWKHGLEIMKKAGVDILVLSHFSPDYDDLTITRMLRKARLETRKVWAARQGYILELQPSHSPSKEKVRGR